MVGKLKPKANTVLSNGDIVVYLHANQRWKSREGIGSYLVEHKMVALRMNKEELNKYFEEVNDEQK